MWCIRALEVVFCVNVFFYAYYVAGEVLMEGGKVCGALGDSTVVIPMQSVCQPLHFLVVSSDFGLWPCMAACESMQQ